MSMTNGGNGSGRMRRDRGMKPDQSSSRPPSPGGNGETGVPTAGGGDASFLGFEITDRRLPYATRIGRHHGLPRLTAKCFAELRHVLDHSVHAKLPRRVRVGLHLQAQLFGPGLAAPSLAIAEKKLLQRRQ